MQKTTRDAAKALYINTYMTAATYIIKHINTRADDNGKTMHKQASELARYRVFMETGLNIKEFKISKADRHKIYEKLGGGKKGKVMSQEVRRELSTSIPNFGDVTSLNKQNIVQKIRNHLNSLDPSVRAGILKAVGLEGDKNLTNKGIPVSENKHNSVKNEQISKAEEAIGKKSDMKARLEYMEKMAKNQAHFEKVGAKYGDTIPIDRIVKPQKIQGTIAFDAREELPEKIDMSGGNPQHEHRHLEMARGRYFDAPYESQPMTYSPGGVEPREIRRLDGAKVFRNTVEPDPRKMLPVPAHEIEQEFFDRVKGNPRYNDPTLFYDLFEDVGATDPFLADRMRADINTARDIAQGHVNAVRRDRKDMSTIQSMLYDGKKTPLNQVVNQQAGNRIGDYLMNGLDMKQDQTQALLGRMAEYMDKELNVPVSVLEADQRNVAKMSRAVAKHNREAKSALDNIDDLTRGQVEAGRYGRTRAYKDFLDEYQSMMDNLTGRSEEVESLYQGYADFGIERETSKNGLLDNEERNALYRSTTYDIKDQDLDAQKEKDFRGRRELTQRQRIQKTILEPMESSNEKVGNKMREHILRTIEANADALTLDGFDGTEEGIAAARKQFADRLLPYVLVGDKKRAFRNLTPEGMTAIVEGWDINPANPKAARGRVDELMKERKGRPLTFFYEAQTNLQKGRFEMWKDAAFQQIESDNQRYLRVPGRIGRFQIAEDDNGVPKVGRDGIRLEGEHILAHNVTVKMDEMTPDEVGRILDELNTRRMDQIEAREYRAAEAEAIIRESHIELVYQQKAVSEDLRQTNEKLFEKLNRVSEFVNGKLPDNEIEARRSVVVPLDNLLEPYQRYMVRSSTPGEQNFSYLPRRVRDMINNQVPYMRSTKNADELASMGYMALRDAIDSLSEDRRVDLSDEGMMRRFKQRNPKATEEVVGEFESQMKGTNLTQRLDDFLGEEVRYRMYDQFYSGFSKEEQRQAGETVVHDIYNTLNEQYGKTQNPEFLPSASNIHSRIRQIGSELEAFPYYKEAQKFKMPEIQSILDEYKDNPSRRSAMSTEDMLYKLRDSSYPDWEEHIADSLDERHPDIERQRYQEAMAERYAEEERLLSRANDIGTPGTPTLEGVVRDELDTLSTRLNAGVKVDSHNSLDFLQSLYEEHQPNGPGLMADVQLDGETYQARISRAKGGDLLAHIPDRNLTVPIYARREQASLDILPHEFEPEQSFGGRVVKDLTQSGGVRRGHIGDYRMLQRNVDANPSDTFDLARQMMSGQKNGVYLDMETTSLSGSSIPEHLVQPLEIYMQEAKWSERKNDFYRVKGEVGVRENGRTRVNTRHLFIEPSQEVQSFAEDLMNRPRREWNTSAVVGGKEFNIMDILEAKGKSKQPQSTGAYRSLRKKIIDQEGGLEAMNNFRKTEDEIWFLRNLAKYSGNADSFAMHTGSMDADLGDMPVADFMGRLREDAKSGIENLKINPETGKLRLLEVMPELKGAQVVTPEEAVHIFSSFTEGKAIMGQNVAEADVPKIFNMANSLTNDEMMRLYENKGQFIDQAVQKFSSIPEPEHMDFLTINDPTSPEGKLHMLTKDQVDAIYDGRSNIDPGSIRLLNDMMDSDEEMARFMNDVAREHYSGDMRKLDSYIDLQDGMSSVAFAPYEETSQINRALQEDIINQMRNAGPEEFVKLLDQHGLADTSRYNELRGLRDTLKNPEVLEQMFVANQVLPNLTSRSAERIQEALDIPAPANQHMAKADVQVGLDVNAESFRRLRQDPAFQAGDGGLLQSGDFVQRHSGGSGEMPLGTYQVESVGDRSLTMRAVQINNGEVRPGQSFTMQAANTSDLDRRFQEGFTTYANLPAAEAGYNDFAADQARRQISRATQKAFNFDRYDSERKMLDVDFSPGGPVEQRSPLAQLGARIRGEEGLPQDDLMDRIATDSRGLVDRADFDRLATPNFTPSKRAAYDGASFTDTEGNVRSFYDSAEGQARRSFLDEVRNMESVGAIDHKVGRELITQMNDDILSRGRDAGFTRFIPNQAHAGVMTDVFGNLSGQRMTIDLTNQSRAGDSLWSVAQAVVNNRKMGTNADQMVELERKREVLNDVIFPFLKDRGLINYDQSTTMNEVTRQLLDRPIAAPAPEFKPGEMQQLEEYDYLKSMREADDAFIGGIRDKHEELMSPYRDQMTPIQQALVEQQSREIDTLRAAGQYDPNMVIRPQIDLSQFPADTISFSDFGGISQTPTGVLGDTMNRLEGSTLEAEVEARRQAASELFKRATAGRSGSIESLATEATHDVDRMHAASVLGYVESDGAGSYRPASNIGEMRFGDLYASGRNSALERFSDRKIKDLPKSLIENVAGGQYTEGNGKSFMSGLLNQYMTDGWEENHRGPDMIPYERVVSEPVQRTGAGPSHLEDMVNERYEDVQRIVKETEIDSARPEGPSALRRFMNDTREDVRGFVGEGGAGHTAAKAGLWIAGIGVAAYALKQFASAGGPLKFEHRPQGHGVEGIGGEGDNDDKRTPEPQAGSGPSTGGKTYVGAGQRGVSIKARARNMNGANPSDITGDLQSDIGNFNVNMRDDRSSMDRRWMEKQMDQYTQRGHLG